jgi:ATP-dependent 26S proteasome regulatory subunit
VLALNCLIDLKALFCGVQVLMATNRIDILDSALLRPGRIDRKIEFPNPSESSRVDILRIHSRKMNLTRGIDLKRIADKMGGASGAELKACCTEAGMFALRERRVHVTQEDFEMAVAKVRCGRVRGPRSSIWDTSHQPAKENGWICCSH